MKQTQLTQQAAISHCNAAIIQFQTKTNKTIQKGFSQFTKYKSLHMTASAASLCKHISKLKTEYNERDIRSLLKIKWSRIVLKTH